MRPAYVTSEFLHQFILSALAEDIGDGDHSTLAAIPSNSIKKARLLIKEDGILAGVELAEQIFHSFDPSLTVDVKLADGTSGKKRGNSFYGRGISAIDSDNRTISIELYAAYERHCHQNQSLKLPNCGHRG